MDPCQCGNGSQTLDEYRTTRTRAYVDLDSSQNGLILVGPDPEKELATVEGENIYKLGPIYGRDRLDLLYAADVFCLPGAVGLSIVDAFHCGLPFVTEEGDESAEIMYLKDGVNGFIVPRDDIKTLSEMLQILLDDPQLRNRFSEAAKREIIENGNQDTLCNGFMAALGFVNDKRNI